LVVHILLWHACQVVVISCSIGGQSTGGVTDLGIMLVGKMEIMPWRKMEIMRKRWMEIMERRKDHIMSHIIIACDVNPFMHLVLLVLEIRW
jgi:hypothetical protein